MEGQNEWPTIEIIVNAKNRPTLGMVDVGGMSGVKPGRLEAFGFSGIE